MILQNHSPNQDKPFQKMLSLELGYVYLAHCTIIWSKKKIICFYSFYSLFVNISQFALEASPYWPAMYCTSKMSLHSPDFLSFT